jgi:hypothetical protein
MFVWFLRWSDVDPTKHPFDIARVRSIVGSIVVAQGDDEALEHAIDRVLHAEFGAWIGGWRWCTRDGGPVTEAFSWWSPSLHKSTRPARQVLRVLAAIADWRGYLEELGRLFAEVRGGSDLASSVERAAALLLPVVVARTGASDAWYRTLSTSLAWYLESSGTHATCLASVIHALRLGSLR